MFSGWTEQRAPVDGSKTYVAKYDARPLMYSVEVYYDVDGVTDAEPVYTREFRYDKSVRLGAESEYTKDGETYYFSHWDVNGETYPSQRITAHPGEGGITVQAKAVFVKDAASAVYEGDANVQITKVEAEKVGPETAREAHRWSFTLTQSVPSGNAEEVGFVMSQTNADPEPGDADVMLARSTLRTYTSTFTTRVDVTGLETEPLYVRAYLKYDGKTFFSDVERVVYADPGV